MLRSFRIAFVLLSALAGALAFAQTLPAPRARFATGLPAAQLVIGQHGMVASQEKLATQIGVEVLRGGGNAVDAAVAVGFAMAVTYPRAGNIGGGGFMVIHLAASHEDIAVDYRETAPMAITRDTFLDNKGNADPKKSLDSPLGIGVPGTVAGLALAHEKYGSGKFTLAQLMAPAIRLAREGIAVDGDIAASLPAVGSRLARWPASAKIFLRADGTSLKPGDMLLQTDLANSLEAIASGGPKAFYEGLVAAQLVAAVRAQGGVMALDDLKNYRAVLRAPVRGTYRGYDIVSMPPPSSGGVHLVEMLNILEGYTPQQINDGAAGLHLMIAAMQRAYADRAVFLGDPDTVKVPVAGLTAKSYAAALRAQIDPERAWPSSDIHPGEPAPREGDNTTHFSVVDSEGNAVANTYTLNYSFGLGMVADGTGILLNNELDDFAVKPMAPNLYGLVGGDANAPGPGKRPLSSMTPTIVLKDGKPFLVTGSPGGSRIITTALQVIVNVIDRGMTLAEAVSAPRVHHQWLPDEVVVEPGLAPDVMQALQAHGHKLTIAGAVTSANSIAITADGLFGVADPRTRGALATGY
jgi:gamma-glutamyltranspeptidase/glutathione hydrolase